MFASSQLRGLYQQSTPDGDVVIAKYNANGDEQWMKATGSSAGKFDYPENMLVTSGGQIYAVGSTDGNTNCSLYALKQDNSCLYNTTFHGLSSAGSFDSFLFKMDGSNDYIGRDYISVYLNGSAPSDTVYLNVIVLTQENLKFKQTLQVGPVGQDLLITMCMCTVYKTTLLMVIKQSI